MAASVPPPRSSALLPVVGAGSMFLILFIGLALALSGRPLWGTTLILAAMLSFPALASVYLYQGAAAAGAAASTSASTAAIPAALLTTTSRAPNAAQAGIRPPAAMAQNKTLQGLASPERTACSGGAP